MLVLGFALASPNSALPHADLDEPARKRQKGEHEILKFKIIASAAGEARRRRLVVWLPLASLHTSSLHPHKLFAAF